VTERFELIVNGAGAAGRTELAGVAMFGREVALIEADQLGGACCRERRSIGMRSRLHFR